MQNLREIQSCRRDPVAGKEFRSYISFRKFEQFKPSLVQSAIIYTLINEPKQERLAKTPYPDERIENALITLYRQKIQTLQHKVSVARRKSE